MILQGSQRRHFYRIFDTFIVYARDYLAERGIIEPKSGPQVMPGAKDVQAIVDAIWGEGGHFEVIDAFEHDPRVTLNRNDKNVVSSWREGIYGSFTAFREGNDVIFLYGDYAFCVRGITREIDRDARLPELAKGVIVPFDGLITYGTTLARHGSLVLTENARERFAADSPATAVLFTASRKRFVS